MNPDLTPRQRQILTLVAEGLCAHEVAKTLTISTETVKSHTKQIRCRLGAANNAQAVAIALRNHLIQ